MDKLTASNDDKRDTAHLVVAYRREMALQGWDDAADEFVNGELLRAALTFICEPGEQFWPFIGIASHRLDEADEVGRMIIAAAMIAAEGDRIRRARLNGQPVKTMLELNGFAEEYLARCIAGLHKIKHEIGGIRDDLNDTEPS